MVVHRVSLPFAFVVSMMVLCFPTLSGMPTLQAASLPDREQACRLVADKLASVSLDDCLTEGLLSSGRFSVEGTPLLVKEYPPREDRIPQARVLVVGGTHGDEYASVSIVFRWMRILDLHHSGLFHWIFVPLLNPDGLLRDRSTRTNARGVDLNRNMPSPLWRDVGYQRWIDTALRNSRYYPGPYPMSEPETRFLVDLIHYFKPHAIVSIHSPLGLVDYDGPGTPVSALGSLHLRRLGNFPGTLGNYAGKIQGIPVVTLELASSVHMPTESETASLWRDLVRWLIDSVPVMPGPDSVIAEEDLELKKEFFGK